MARLPCCRLCCVEMARIALADGTVALICLDCDLLALALAHEAGRGARPSPAGIAAARRREPRRRRRDGQAP